MAKPLSEQLADMSVRAKNAEDAVAAARQETHDKVVARQEQTRAAATAAVDQVNQDLKSAGDTVAGRWDALRAKVAADIDSLQAARAQREHEHDVKRAQEHADALERDAAVAVAYAIAAIEQAKLAVLDSVVARLEAAEISNA